jgi:hypothetical protein
MASERRRRASLSLHDWWTSDLMVGVEASADQWSGHAPALSVGTRVERRFLGDQLGLHGRVQGWWSQERPFYAGALGMGAQTATAGGRSTVRFRIALEWASPRAPLALWPGAGTGAGRDALLRGHPLIRGGIVTGAAFGRRLITGGVELERRVAAPAGMRVALALFLDGAQVAAPEGGPGQRGTHVDVGAGVRLALPGSDSVFRIDIAHPVRGSGVQLSAGWQGRLR